MTNLKDWRASRQATLTTPSGLVVTVRRVQLVDLIANGGIPQTLDALAKRATEKGFTVTEAMEFMPLINSVVKSAIISPPLADEPDDQHLTLDEVGFEDRMAIFSWANGDATALTSFREQQAGDVESAPAGADVSATA
jgi:hypothetical protein